MREVDVAIVGGGISGLTLALELHDRGIRSRVFEAAPELRELGVGLSMHAHATKALSRLGLLPQLQAKAVEFKESCFFNRAGQLIYRDPAYGSEFPQFLIHRGDLQTTLANAVRERLGADSIVLGHRCAGFEQDADSVTAFFADPVTGDALPSQRADVLLACDGVRSAIRAQLYPDESDLRYSGTMMWRAVSRHAPILSGGAHIRIGTVDPGKMVIYPIRDDVDGEGNQLINWVAEVFQENTSGSPDWMRPGRVEDFLPRFQDWHFDWLDVPELFHSADQIFQTPMSDRDPIDQWAFGRVALVGDAAHPMIPRGSNGAGQAILDTGAVADALSRADGPVAALRAYEAERLPKANTVVLTNRTTPPDYLILEVERRTGFQPFDRLEDVISEAELAELLERYKQIAGYTREALSQSVLEPPVPSN